MHSQWVYGSGIENGQCLCGPLRAYGIRVNPSKPGRIFPSVPATRRAPQPSTPLSPKNLSQTEPNRTKPNHSEVWFYRKLPLTLPSPSSSVRPVMPNTKSAERRMRNSARKQLHNRSIKSRLHTLEKSYLELIGTGKKDDAAKALQT